MPFKHTLDIDFKRGRITYKPINKPRIKRESDEPKSPKRKIGPSDQLKAISNSKNIHLKPTSSIITHINEDVLTNRRVDEYRNLGKLFRHERYHNIFDFPDKPIYEDHIKSDCNLEHIFPQSKFKSFPSLKSDLHHIFFCSKSINNARANFDYEQIDGINDGKYRVNTKKKTFDPPIKDKGKVARAIAYVLCLYPELSDEHVISTNTIVIWNMISPVTYEDIERNDKVEEIQHNRNPFVDYPNLINLIWGRHPIQMLVNGEEILYTPSF